MSELKLRPPKPARLFFAISAGRGGRREIPLCAARPFAGAKGEKKSGCSVRNDGRGGGMSELKLRFPERGRVARCLLGAPMLSQPRSRQDAGATSYPSRRSKLAGAAVMSELKLRPLTRSAGLGLARCVRLFARGCRLPAWLLGTLMARRLRRRGCRLRRRRTAWNS